MKVVRGTRGLGMGGHHQPVEGETAEWLTPPELLERLGPFDLDPCAPRTRPWDTADYHYTIRDNGLLQPWWGMVWCNPPYGTETWKWLARMATHRNGIALVFARTETDGFQRSAWATADAMLFLKGRLFFHHVTGERAAHNAGAPSVLLAYGARAVARLHASNLPGAFVTGWEMLDGS